jgi:hypothetical protein
MEVAEESGGYSVSGNRDAAIRLLEQNVPAELRALHQWVAWKLEPPLRQGDKWRKVPYSPTTGTRASTTDPTDYGAFDEALTLWRQRDMTGVGFVFTEADPYVGIDLDGCVDPNTGHVSDWAREIIDELDSYAETSTSGTGVHVLVKAKLPPTGRKAGNLEMYESGRYFAMTGRLLPGSHASPQERQPSIEYLHSRYIAKAATEKPAKAEILRFSYDDARILELCGQAKNAAKFQRLWDGDFRGYKSQSEADLALLGILKFYTQDAGQLDRLFRQSGLMRAKWDSRRGDQTYGQQTIQLALDDVRETYTPPALNVRLSKPTARPAAEEEQDDVDPLVDVTPWPDPPEDAAYYGLAGDLVRAVEPFTEADPVAILIQALVGFGNLIGRGPHFVAEASRHYTNTFAVLVGATAKGRKGSSWGHVYNVLKEVDEEWATRRKLSGLSSGEGLIWEVRDAIRQRQLIKRKGEDPVYEELEVDPGITDKRLLAFEGEFAAALKVMGRQGNTLSTTIRQAWDDGNLNTMVKNSPGRATNAHISIVGHVTKDELLKDMAATETSNGFANRFIWVCVRRSKCLPEGDEAQGLDLSPLVQGFQQAVDFATHVNQMRRDGQARDLWHHVYPELSDGKPGLFGLVTSRAEAQVMRLACIYALLDRSVEIGLAHLEAALALWRYAEASCRWIFGDSLGDPTADEILKALRASGNGMSRTDISNTLGRHKDKTDIARALGVLVRNGLARRTKMETGGRPLEWWESIGMRARKDF